MASAASSKGYPGLDGRISILKSASLTCPFKDRESSKYTGKQVENWFMSHSENNILASWELMKDEIKNIVNSGDANAKDQLNYIKTKCPLLTHEVDSRLSELNNEGKQTVSLGSDKDVPIIDKLKADLENLTSAISGLPQKYVNKNSRYNQLLAEYRAAIDMLANNQKLDKTRLEQLTEEKDSVMNAIRHDKSLSETRIERSGMIQAVASLNGEGSITIKGFNKLVDPGMPADIYRRTLRSTIRKYMKASIQTSSFKSAWKELVQKHNLKGVGEPRVESKYNSKTDTHTHTVMVKYKGKDWKLSDLEKELDPSLEGKGVTPLAKIFYEGFGAKVGTDRTMSNNVRMSDMDKALTRSSAPKKGFTAGPGPNKGTAPTKATIKIGNSGVDAAKGKDGAATAAGPG